MWWEMSRGAYHASSKRIKVRIYWRKQHYINCFCAQKNAHSRARTDTHSPQVHKHTCVSPGDGMKTTLIPLVRLSHRFYGAKKDPLPFPSRQVHSVLFIQMYKVWFILIFLSIDRAFDATIDGVFWLIICFGCNQNMQFILYCIMVRVDTRLWSAADKRAIHCYHLFTVLDRWAIACILSKYLIYNTE